MIRIVILDKGFVAVGVYSQGENGWCRLENAAIVRRWGTSKGLGEIAAGGPTERTIIDKTPAQSFPVAAIVNTIECDRSKWEKVLGL